MPTISVVVPVRGVMPSPCLWALCRQKYPAGRFDIVIVDNNDTPRVRVPPSKEVRVKVVYENARGSYAARNAGVCHAHGDLLAFTDADCVPAADWLTSAAQWFARTGPKTVLAGAVIRDRRPAGSTAAEWYDETFFLRQEYYVRRAGFGVTANLLVTAGQFAEAGPFDPTLTSGGDMEWAARARACGARLVYAPDVQVWHPTLSTVRQVIRKARRVAGGRAALTRRALRSEWLGIVGEVVAAVSRCRQFSREHPTVVGRMRVRVYALVALVQLVRAAERVRVLGGGAALRQ